MRKPILLLSFCLITLIVQAQSPDDPQWLRYPAISPDGQHIAFTYKGDIYKVSRDGGLAYPLTLHEARDFMPVWSHDGKQIAFASDRYGNYDVFTLSSEGGESRRLTYHSSHDYPSDFTVDDQQVLFSSARLDIASNQQFPSGVLPELYAVPIGGGTPRIVLTTPAQMARFHDSGKKIVFHDRNGYEDEFRKHHTSSVTRDIWTYDLESETYRQISTFDGEDRDPVFVPGEEAIYYLSEEKGDFNVFKKKLDGTEPSRQLTQFEKHPVRNLSVSSDGILCFSFDGEIYTLKPGGSPEKVSVKIQTGDRYNERKLEKVSKKISEFDLSPNGKEVAFVVRGEVFVASTNEGTTRRITSTPQQERSVSFSPDGRSILYAGERDGSWNVYQTTIRREEEPYFFNATVLDEEALIQTPAEEFQPAYSPDGKEVAYLEERTALKVLNLATKESRLIVPGDRNYSYSDGDQHYAWSPDSKWFLVEFLQPNQWTSQAGLVSASGDSEIINLSKSGYGNYSPRWMMDGKMMMWVSDRDGMKNHGSWGGELDIYAMFFTQEAYDRFRLSEEEFEILKEQEEETEEDEEKEEKNDKKEEEEIGPLEFDLNDIEDRKVRLSRHSSDLADAWVSQDGEKLFYLAKFEKGYDLWQTENRSRETKILAKLNAESAGDLRMDQQEKYLFLRADGQIHRIEIESGEKKTLGISGEMYVDEAAERAYLFEHVWRQVDKKFYLKDLHQVEWDYYKESYERFLPHLDNKADFAEMLSELLGELNASHTGARYRPENSEGDQTAALGVFFDPEYRGEGMKIAEVMEKSPVVKEGTRIEPGVIIEAIDGQSIADSVNYYALLNRQTGDNTLLSLYDPATEKRWEEVVKPISLGAENELRYDRWVDRCRSIVDSLSGGRIGYVHVRGMNDQSYRTVYEEVLGENANKEALVVDTRFNGGGWLHDDLATFLAGTEYITFMPRGQNLGSEPQFKWKRPSVVVMSESNYSDAHMFPYAYKQLGIGKLVGMPVPGTGTAVWWERLHTGDLIFGIPQVGMLGTDGKFLENNQLEPDIQVPNEPGKVNRGIDQQLAAAVRELLDQLKPAKP